jgi:putative aminopeptidase FrvX
MITPPTRYTHSPFEMIHEADVENTIRLLTAYLES